MVREIKTEIKLFVMTQVRILNKPARSFNNFMDDFLTGMPSIISDELLVPNGKHSTPVNIREIGNEFVLEVVAPGFEKENFAINLDKNILTVSAERKNETNNGNEKVIRNEYKFQSFKRSFTIDEKIDASGIVAKYVNGVLTLNLPRKEEVKEPVKQISII
jgi:HSP20 family protein